MYQRIWDGIVSLCLIIGLPLLSFYHALCSNPFLNIAIQNAPVLEKTGDFLLIPVHYVLAGKEASFEENGNWVFHQRFDYEEAFFIKSVACILAFPFSLSMGCAIKGLSFLDPKTRSLHTSLVNNRNSTEVQPHHEYYEKIGIHLQDLASSEWFPSQGYQRRPKDELHMQKTKEGMKDIASLLTDAHIPWWVDCGTLLGTYRYGGIIPWDYDIDIAVLAPDFENVRRTLQRLDPEKYEVQDWSGRNLPDTFLKVFVKESKDFIDLYFYAIDPKEKQIRYIFSLENNIFFFEWWKIDERRFKKPIGFDVVFPLKKALFDGIEVFIPNQPVPFLQRYYGDNLAPAKIYNSETQTFEKDLSHPYWQNAYVH